MLSAILFVALISSTSVMCETPDPDEEPLPTQDPDEEPTEPSEYEPPNDDYLITEPTVDPAYDDDYRDPPIDPNPSENNAHEDNGPGKVEQAQADEPKISSQRTPWLLIMFFIIVFICLGGYLAYIVYDVSTLQKEKKDRKQISASKPKVTNGSGKSQSTAISDNLSVRV